MQIRLLGNALQKALWKILTNPAIEVVAAILLMLLAAWIVIATEIDLRQHNPFPVLTGHK
jgi:hypothetical protein